MTANPEPLASILARQLGITEIEVNKRLAEAVRAGFLGVEDDPSDPSMVRLVARFPGESA
jgi:hypothetical protein